MKYSMKDFLVLFEMHSTIDNSLSEILQNSAAAKLLYNRLLAKSVDTNGQQKWILKPKGGISRVKSVEEWLLDDRSATSMNSKDLVLYFKPSTYRTALVNMVGSGLIFIDDFNKMFINYPVNGKLLSLEYAAKTIKSSYRKNNGKEISNGKEASNKNFWE